MRSGVVWRWFAALLPAAVLAAGLIAVASPASSSAASGVTPFDVTTTLSCLAAPGFLNVPAALGVEIKGDAPASVAPGDAVTLTNLTTALTVPSNLVGAFTLLDAVTASGTVTQVPFDITGSSLTSANLATPPIPFGPLPLVSGEGLSATVPATGTLTLAAGTASASASSMSITLDSSPAFTTADVATGSGLVASVGATTTTGTKIGPFPIDCTAPSGVVLATIPIQASTTTTTTTTPTTTTTTPTTTTTTTPTTTTTTPDAMVPFDNWDVSGTITAHKLNQSLSVPAGSRFNGSADLTTHTLSSQLTVPPFTASLSLFGLSASAGLNLTEVGTATGTIYPDAENPADVDITVSAKANLAVTSVGLFGFTLPLSCATKSPIALNLSITEPALSLLSGLKFSGTITFPSIGCHGFLGGLLGGAFTLLLSGPNNPYTLAIAPPSSSS